MNFRALTTAFVSVVILFISRWLFLAYFAAEANWISDVPPTHRLFGFNADSVIPTLAWSCGFVTAGLVWVAVFSSLHRLRFGIPFGGGIALLTLGCRFAIITYSRPEWWAWPGASMSVGFVFSAPLLIATSTLVALLSITWSIRSNESNVA